MTIRSPGTALITGASTGIGATYADRLVRRGYDVILVARNRAKLEELATQLRKESQALVTVLAADLTDAAQLQRIETAAASAPNLSLLVNNAGSATLGALAQADVERLEQEIKLNILAPTRLARAVLPSFLSRKHGAIINIASVMSEMVQPGNSVYGGTKAYLLHFSQVLAEETKGAGIKIQAVLPGATRTPLWATAGIDLASFPPEMVMEVGDMVDAALAGFDQGENVTVPSLPNAEDWQKLIAARNALRPNLSLRAPAPRYGVGVH